MRFGQWAGSLIIPIREYLHLGRKTDFDVRYCNTDRCLFPQTMDRCILIYSTGDKRHVHLGDWVILNDDGTLFRDLDYLEEFKSK